MIDKLKSPKQFKKSKRVGRGYASTKGSHTTGKGNKGQKARSGYKKPARDFEGGQNPLSRRLPTLRGISKNSRNRSFITSKTKVFEIKLSELENFFGAKDKITKESLREKGLVKDQANKIVTEKILFDKEASKKLHVDGVKVSKKAKESIEKAGGSVK